MTDRLPKPVSTKVESRFVFKLCSTSPILTLRSVFVRDSKEHILGLNFNTSDYDDGLTVQHNFYLGDSLDKLKHFLRMFAKGKSGPYGLGPYNEDDVAISCSDREVAGYFKFHPFGVPEMSVTKVFSPRKTDNIDVAVDQLLVLLNLIENGRAIDERQSETLSLIKDGTGFFPQCNMRTTFKYDDVSWPAE